MKAKIKKLHKHLQPHFPWLKKLGRIALRVTRHTGRTVWYAGALVLVLLAALYTGARVYLPTVADRKPDIEAFLSERIAHQVRIGQLATYWDGLSPGVRLDGFEIYAAAAMRPSVRLTQVHLSIAPWPLLWGEVRIDRLRLAGPKLSFERLADGRFRVSGFEALEAGSAEAGEAFMHWLFRQHRLEIADGELQWYDHKHANDAVHLTGVNLTLRNDGDRHRLGFQARFPAELCRDCQLVADITGNPFLGSEWEGDLYLRAQGLNVERLPGIARERLPAGLRGRFGLELWSEWDASRPVRVTGTARVSGLQLPLPQLPLPMAVREAHAGVDWSLRGKGWELELENLVLALSGPMWSAGNTRLAFAPEKQSLRMQHVYLTDVTRWLATLKPQGEGEVAALRPALAAWREFHPEGALNDLRLEFTDRWGETERFSIKADVAGLRTHPRGQIPGVENLSGALKFDQDSGEFRMDSRGLKVFLARQFRAPFTLTRADAWFGWSREVDHWAVEGERIDLEGEDGKAKGEFELRVPHETRRSPYLKLRVDVRDGNGAHAARYYPVHTLDPETLAWMEYAFAGGYVESGHVIYDGNVHDFPFRPGQGRFEIQARVRDAVYVYLPGWEPARDVRAEVAIRDNQVLVTGSGKIRGLAADPIRVQSAFGPGSDDWVRVNVRVRGEVDETLQVLRAAKAEPGERWKEFVPSAIAGRGEGTLNLAVDVPLGTQPARVRGEYRFDESGLVMRDSGAGAEGLRGTIVFNETGPSGGQVTGRVLGGDAALAIQSSGEQQLQIAAHGRLRGEELGKLYGPAFGRHIAGVADWSGQAAITRGVTKLAAELDLSGLTSTLPAPLHRPKGLADGKLTVQSEPAGAGLHLLSVNAPGLLAGRLQFARGQQGWGFDRGQVAFQDAFSGLPAGRGLHLRAQLAALDVDDWLRLRTGGGKAPAWLARVSADIRALDLFERQFGAVKLDFAQRKQGWEGAIQGAAAEGRVVVDTANATRVALEFAHLDLPEKKLGPARPSETLDPRKLPAVRVRVDNLTRKGQALGSIELEASPRADGWRIARAVLAREEMTLEGNGDWRMVGGKPVSSAELRFVTRDAGKSLTAFGAPEQLAGGNVEIKSKLSWPGSPMEVSAAAVDGQIEVAARDGRFLKLKQGAARLFGMLDLSAIGRYLTLDFSSAFGRGFAYDRIQGTVKFEHGNAYTHDLIMKGPSAQMGVSGRVGLAAEDFDLLVVVDPQVSDALTLTSWGIWGPQVAAAVLAFQKVFKKQIAEGTRVSYVVKGAWADASVTRLGTDQPAKPGE